MKTDKDVGGRAPHGTADNHIGIETKSAGAGCARARERAEQWPASSDLCEKARRGMNTLRSRLEKGGIMWERQQRE